MARKAKLSPDIQAKIVGLIKAGNFSSTACALAGVSESTFYRWMDRGRGAKSGRYREFWEAVEQAKAFAEAKYLEVIQQVADDLHHKDRLKAATWWLERRHAGKYSPTMITELKGGFEVKRVEELSDDELASIARGGG